MMILLALLFLVAVAIGVHVALAVAAELLPAGADGPQAAAPTPRV